MFIIIPVAAETPLEETPRVTYGVVGVLISVWCFFTILWLGENYAGLQLGTRDALVRQLAFIDNERHPWTYLTSSLVHLNVIHLLFNLTFVWLLGCYVEERLGWWLYLLLLVMGGVAGNLAYSWGVWYYADHVGGAHLFMGASGIVTTLFGAQLVLLPNLEFRFLFIWLIHFMYQPVSDNLTLPAIACIPVWLSLKIFASYMLGDLSMAVYTAAMGGFVWGLGVGMWMRLSPNSMIFERSRQRFEVMRQRKLAMLDYQNFRTALNGDAPKAAFDIYRRTRKTENPLPVTTGERMDLANQLLVLGDVIAAGSVYRDVLKSETDMNILFEAGLRLSRIALYRLGDIQEAKDLLRNLDDRYKGHRRYSEVLDLIEHLKEIEGRPFAGTG
jgi:membrane associated rhomboid family serine protease